MLPLQRHRRWFICEVGSQVTVWALCNQYLSEEEFPINTTQPSDHQEQKPAQSLFSFYPSGAWWWSPQMQGFSKLFIWYFLPNLKIYVNPSLLGILHEKSPINCQAKDCQPCVCVLAMLDTLLVRVTDRHCSARLFLRLGYRCYLPCLVSEMFRCLRILTYEGWFVVFW